MSILDRHRYFLLAALVLMMMIAYASNGIWSPDFWEHTAVVRELAAHPTAPQNPLISSPATHALYSPYALVEAWVVRLSGLSAPTVRVVFGILNVALWLTALKWLVDTVAGTGHAAFYTLLFTLALWGFGPWDSSGFLHLNALGQTMSYPATFATALVFVIFALFVRILRRGQLLWVLALAPLMSFAALSHPVSAISMYTGLAALALGFSGGRVVRTFTVLAAACAVSLALATAWPLYPFASVLVSHTALYSRPEATLYPGLAGLVSRTFPALPGLAVLVSRVRAQRRDYLAWMFLATCAVYIYGAATSQYIFCRVMPFLVFPLHLALAEWTVHAHRRVFPAMMALLAAGAVNAVPGALACLPVFESSSRQYGFLEHYSQPSDVFLSDLNTSLKIPAFGGKVVACAHVLPFVRDHERRRRDVVRFLEPDTPPGERGAILARYRVRYVLVNKAETESWPALLGALAPAATLLYASGDLFLFRFDGPP
jgi:alpha-1,6-mannosyltransferase